MTVFSDLARAAAIGATALAVSGCATALRGTKTDFIIATEPAGATVKTDLETKKSKREKRQQRYVPATLSTYEPEYYGCAPTPCKFKVSRNSEFTVTITMEGYHPATIQVKNKFGGGKTSAAGAAATTTGAYLASYAVISSATYMATSLVSALTFGATTATNAGAAAAATTVAGGVGIIMLGVDLASGAMLDLYPNPAMLILIPADQPLPEGPTEFIDSEEKLKELLEQLKKKKTDKLAMNTK